MCLLIAPTPSSDQHKAHRRCASQLLLLFDRPIRSILKLGLLISHRSSRPIQSRLKAVLLIDPTPSQTDANLMEGVRTKCSDSSSDQYKANWRCAYYLVQLFLEPIHGRLKVCPWIAPTPSRTNTKQTEDVPVNWSYSLTDKYKADWRCPYGYFYAFSDQY